MCMPGKGKLYVRIGKHLTSPVRRVVAHKHFKHTVRAVQGTVELRIIGKRRLAAVLDTYDGDAVIAPADKHMLIVEQPPTHCLLTDKKAVEIRRLSFGAVPLGVCAVIMVAEDRKHTVRGLYFTENPHGLEQLGRRSIHYVARKQHQIGLLRIYNRHRFGKGAAVFRPAPGMYVRNLH